MNVDKDLEAMANEEPALKKSLEALSDRQNKKADTELKKYIEETYNTTNKKQSAFILEYMKGGLAYKAYQTVYGEHIEKASAAVMASNLLKKLKFQICDYLDNSGHTISEMLEVLETMKDKDPKEYIKYMMKLRGLETQKVEMTGQISIPQLIIKPLTNEDQIEEEEE